MFRPREQSQRQPLESLRLSRFQQRRLVGSWAIAFRDHILPLLREEEFAHFFHQSHGAPNRSVQVVLGILLLKEMFSLSDPEALEHFAFDLRWHVALDVVDEPVSCCQKTLHNFRVRLREHDASRKLFEDIAARLCNLLDLDTAHQRLDSTHIRSDCAILTRLGLFCESIRLFLRRLQREQRDCFNAVPEQLRCRYLDDDGDASRYDSTDRERGKRRLPVVARDLQRLLERFAENRELAVWPELATLQRLLSEQCHTTVEPIQPKETDDDAALGAQSVQPCEPKDICSASLQTPHDPDVTYGKKGQGYEVHICETFGNKTEAEPDKPELITFVDVTPSCESDVHVTIPTVKDLKKRNMQPEHLEVDANYTGSAVIIEAREMGTDVNGPVKGHTALPSKDEVTIGDFQVDLTGAQQSKCPAGHPLLSQKIEETAKGKEEAKTEGPTQEEKMPRRISLAMLATVCAVCQMAPACPMADKKDSKVEGDKEGEGKKVEGRRVLRMTEEELVSSQRRRYQTTPEYAKKHSNRAGIEATNSEAKRAHGLAKLRVRGKERVKQAVYLKLAACNIKRVVHYLGRVAKRQK